MYVKSSPPQQDAVVEFWTADFLVFGQALYHWAILPPCCNRMVSIMVFSLNIILSDRYTLCRGRDLNHRLATRKAGFTTCFKPNKHIYIWCLAQKCIILWYLQNAKSLSLGWLWCSSESGKNCKYRLQQANYKKSLFLKEHNSYMFAYLHLLNWNRPICNILLSVFFPTIVFS